MKLEQLYDFPKREKQYILTITDMELASINLLGMDKSKLTQIENSPKISDKIGVLWSIVDTIEKVREATPR